MTDPPDQSRTEPATGRKQPGSSSRSPLRLLVVDDEETVRYSLIRYLRRQGHQVAEASDGREALRLLEEGARYHVILSDLRMPGLTGDQLLLKLQEQHDEHCRRIIFLSGDEPSGEVARILAAAGSPVILKPYDLREISRLVESYAGRSGDESNAG